MKKLIIILLVIQSFSNSLVAQQFELIPLDAKYEIKWKYCMAMDSKNNLYLGTDKGLLEYKNNSWNLIQFDDTYNNIKTVFIDSKDRIWCIMQFNRGKDVIGCLYRIDNNDKVFINPLIESAFINSIEEDSEGNIWVSTGKMGYYKSKEGFSLKKKEYPGGIYRYTDGIWTREIKGGYTEKIISLQNKIFFIDEKDAGDKGYWYKNKELVELPTKSFWGKQRVLDIAESENGKIWVCTAENRLQIYSMNEEGALEEVLKMNPFRYGIPGKFYNINKNLYLTYLGMFFAYDKEKDLWFYPPKQSNQNLKFYIRDIEELPDGSVLIATGEGIKQYKDGVITKTQWLEDKEVKIIHALNDHQILIGTTEDGIFLLEDQKLRPVKTDDKGASLPVKYTYLVTNDNQIMFINTNSGVLKVSME